MRRPLALWGFTFLGCAMCHMVFGKTAAYGLLGAALLGVLACLLLYNKIKSQPVGWAAAHISLAVVLSVGLLLCSSTAMISPMEAYHAKDETMVVTVVEERGHYDRAGYYTVTGQMPNERSARLQLQVQGDTRYQVGDVIEGKLQFAAPSASQANRLLSERIVLVAKTDKDHPPVVVGQTKNIYYYAHRVNRALYQKIQSVLPDETASMVVGICLGDTSEIPQRVLSWFSACGMSHMTAVSGLHTTTLVGFLVALFVFLRWHQRWANLLGVVLIWSFIFVVGLPTSAVRAGIMFTLLAVVSLLGYTSDTLNNLGGAVLAILLVNPFAVGDIGFIASVSACLGIIVCAKSFGGLFRLFFPSRVRENKVVVGVTDSFGVTVSAFTANLFCSLLGFYRFSLVAPLANLVGVPMAGVVLVCSLMGGALMFVPGLSFCGGLLLVVGGWFAQGLVLVARFCSSIPYADLPFASLWCMVASLLVLAGGILTYRYRRNLSAFQKRGIAILLALLLVAAPFLPIYTTNSYEVVVMGNSADATVAVIGREVCVVIGCSSVYSLTSVLASRQVEAIDCLILPPRATYGSSLRELCDTITVQTIATDQSNILRGLVDFAAASMVSSNPIVQVDNVNITANQGFTSFAIVVGNQRLVYETEEVTTASESVVITHPAISEIPMVAINRLSYGAEDVLVLKIKPSVLQVYRPRYLYG